MCLYHDELYHLETSTASLLLLSLNVCVCEMLDRSTDITALTLPSILLFITLSSIFFSLSLSCASHKQRRREERRGEQDRIECEITCLPLHDRKIFLKSSLCKGNISFRKDRRSSIFYNQRIIRSVRLTLIERWLRSSHDGQE